MTNQPDYRLYLEEKFAGLNTHINAQFEIVHDRLELIKEQTTKTNGRVTELEKEVDGLHEKLVMHPLECSKAKEISELKEDLIEYKFFKRYPKLTAVILAIFAIGIFISAYGTFSTIHNNIKSKAMEQTIDTINQNTK